MPMSIWVRKEVGSGWNPDEPDICYCDLAWPGALDPEVKGPLRKCCLWGRGGTISLDKSAQPSRQVWSVQDPALTGLLHLRLVAATTG